MLAFRTLTIPLPARLQRPDLDHTVRHRAGARRGDLDGGGDKTLAGQALYSTLGWRLVSPLTTAVRE